MKVVAELTDEQVQLLNKYGYLDVQLMRDQEILESIIVKKEIKGPEKVSLKQLQKGLEWSCDKLPVTFDNIPASLQSSIQILLGASRARELWGGEEVIEIE